MPKTNFAVAQWTPQESWRTVRSFRASPTEQVTRTLAASVVRRSVFHTALEQAQSLFEAAALANRESRPLLTFYGISQAGRALAAASSQLGRNNTDPAHRSFEGRGHGLTFNPSAVTADTLWSTASAVKATPSDSLSRTAIALGNPLDDGAFPLGSLANQLYDFTVAFPKFPKWPAVFEANGNTDLTGEYRLEVTVMPEGPQETAAWYRSHYPTLAHAVPHRDLDGEIQLRRDRNTLLLVVPRPGPDAPPTTTTYGGLRCFLPAAGEPPQQIAPLLSWWILLHAFSMLARYSPQRWAALLDLRSSKVASQVEHLQEQALIAIPRLIAESLEVLP